MADLRSPERTWEHFSLFLCLLSQGNAGKMSTATHRKIDTHSHARTHPGVRKTRTGNGGIGAGGAVGNQRVYVTQDFIDKSLEAQSFTHKKRQLCTNSSSVLQFINSMLPWFHRTDVIVIVNLCVTVVCLCSARKKTAIWSLN